MKIEDYWKLKIEDYWKLKIEDYWRLKIIEDWRLKIELDVGANSFMLGGISDCKWLVGGGGTHI